MSEKREKFEDWVRYSGLSKLIDLTSFHDGISPEKYKSWDTRMAFMAWSAAWEKSQEELISG